MIPPIPISLGDTYGRDRDRNYQNRSQNDQNFGSQNGQNLGQNRGQKGKESHKEYRSNHKTTTNPPPIHRSTKDGQNDQNLNQNLGKNDQDCQSLPENDISLGFTEPIDVANFESTNIQLLEKKSNGQNLKNTTQLEGKKQREKEKNGSKMKNEISQKHQQQEEEKNGGSDDNDDDDDSDQYGLINDGFVDFEGIDDDGDDGRASEKPKFKTMGDDDDDNDDDTSGDNDESFEETDEGNDTNVENNDKNDKNINKNEINPTEPGSSSLSSTSLELYETYPLSPGARRRPELTPTGLYDFYPYNPQKTLKNSQNTLKSSKNTGNISEFSTLQFPTNLDRFLSYPSYKKFIRQEPYPINPHSLLSKYQSLTKQEKLDDIDNQFIWTSLHSTEDEKNAQLIATSSEYPLLKKKSIFLYEYYNSLNYIDRRIPPIKPGDVFKRTALLNPKERYVPASRDKSLYRRNVHFTTSHRYELEQLNERIISSMKASLPVNWIYIEEEVIRQNWMMGSVVKVEDLKRLGLVDVETGKIPVKNNQNNNNKKIKNIENEKKNNNNNDNKKNIKKEKKDNFTSHLLHLTQRHNSLLTTPFPRKFYKQSSELSNLPYESTHDWYCENQLSLWAPVQRKKEIEKLVTEYRFSRSKMILVHNIIERMHTDPELIPLSMALLHTVAQADPLLNPEYCIPNKLSAVIGTNSLTTVPDQLSREPVPFDINTVPVEFDTLRPCRSFEQVGFPDYIQTLFNNASFTTPTAVQSQTWPMLLSGHDIVAIAPTGSGKTLAYLLPAIIHINAQPRTRPGEGPVALILAPSRDLSLQIAEECRRITVGTDIITELMIEADQNIMNNLCFKKRYDILIATTDILTQCLQKFSNFNLNRVSFLIFDEVDALLNYTYMSQLQQLVKVIRPDRQTVMFSASWELGNEVAMNQLLKNTPFFIQIGKSTVQTVSTVKQQTFLTKYVSNEFQETVKFLIDFCHRSIEQIMVFCPSIQLSQQLAAQLRILRIPSGYMNEKQEQKVRSQVLEDFKGKKFRVLAVTDIASRGLDLPGLKYVVNMGLPIDIQNLPHRIGRVGRAGKQGWCYNIISSDRKPNSLRIFTKLLIDAKQQVPDELLLRFDPNIDQKFFSKKKNGHNNDDAREDDDDNDDEDDEDIEEEGQSKNKNKKNGKNNNKNDKKNKNGKKNENGKIVKDESTSLKSSQNKKFLKDVMENRHESALLRAVKVVWYQNNDEVFDLSNVPFASLKVSQTNEIVALQEKSKFEFLILETKRIFDKVLPMLYGLKVDVWIDDMIIGGDDSVGKNEQNSYKNNNKEEKKIPPHTPQKNFQEKNTQNVLPAQQGNHQQQQGQARLIITRKDGANTIIPIVPQKIDFPQRGQLLFDLFEKSQKFWEKLDHQKNINKNEKKELPLINLENLQNLKNLEKFTNLTEIDGNKNNLLNFDNFEILLKNEKKIYKEGIIDEKSTNNNNKDNKKKEDNNNDQNTNTLADSNTIANGSGSGSGDLSIGDKKNEKNDNIKKNNSKNKKINELIENNKKIINFIKIFEKKITNPIFYKFLLLWTFLFLPDLLGFHDRIHSNARHVESLRHATFCSKTAWKDLSKGNSLTSQGIDNSSSNQVHKSEKKNKQNKQNNSENNNDNNTTMANNDDMNSGNNSHYLSKGQKYGILSYNAILNGDSVTDVYKFPNEPDDQGSVDWGKREKTIWKARGGGKPITTPTTNATISGGGHGGSGTQNGQNTTMGDDDNDQNDKNNQNNDQNSKKKRKSSTVLSSITTSSLNDDSPSQNRFVSKFPMVHGHGTFAEHQEKIEKAQKWNEKENFRQKERENNEIWTKTAISDAKLGLNQGAVSLEQQALNRKTEQPGGNGKGGNGNSKGGNHSNVNNHQGKNNNGSQNNGSKNNKGPDNKNNNGPKKNGPDSKANNGPKNNNNMNNDTSNGKNEESSKSNKKRKNKKNNQTSSSDDKNTVSMTTTPPTTTTRMTDATTPLPPPISITAGITPTTTGIKKLKRKFLAKTLEKEKEL